MTRFIRTANLIKTNDWYNHHGDPHVNHRGIWATILTHESDSDLLTESQNFILHKYKSKYQLHYFRKYYSKFTFCC